MFFLTIKFWIFSIWFLIFYSRLFCLDSPQRSRQIQTSRATEHQRHPVQPVLDEQVRIRRQKVLKCPRSHLLPWVYWLGNSCGQSSSVHSGFVFAQDCHVQCYSRCLRQKLQSFPSKIIYFLFDICFSLLMSLMLYVCHFILITTIYNNINKCSQYLTWNSFNAFNRLQFWI